MFQMRWQYSKHVANVATRCEYSKYVANVSNALQIFKTFCNCFKRVANN